MPHESDDLPAFHRATVTPLLNDTPPMRRLWSVSRRLAAWALLSVAIVAGTVAIGARPNLPARFTDARFVALWVSLLLGATQVALLSLRGAIPGRARRTDGLRALGILIVVAALASLGPSDGVATLTDFVALGLGCSTRVLLMGMLPAVLLTVAVARGAALRPSATMACAWAGSLLVGAAAVTVACPLEDRLHVLVWHLLPVVTTAAGVAAGVALWKRGRFP
jgi:hypothetical protein